MLADPAIRARIQSDSTLRRLMREAGLAVPAARKPASTKSRPASAKAKTASKPKPKPASKPKPAADPHAGMDHSKMDMQKKK
jgi:hypothetical protein